MKKSIIIIVFFAFIACAVVADDVLLKRDEEYSGFCGKDVYWSYNRTTNILLIKGDGDMTEYDGDESVPWKDLRSFIKEVIIKEGVTSLGSYAFYSCVSLKTITIPMSVTSIGEHCFERCFDLEAIAVPRNVTSIADFTFTSCKGLVDISLPSNISSIGENAFQRCSNLVSIAIPSSVTAIGKRAFQFCTSLANLSLPSSVTSIGDFAFQYCDSLISIVIPPKVTILEGSVFSYCVNLTQVVLPPNLQTIRNFAFAHCGLTNVTIPATVTTIEQSAFSGCSQLSDVRLSSNGLTTLGKWAFARTNISTITIPSTVTSIGNEAFSFCHNLISIDVDYTNTVFMSVDGVLFKRDNMVLVHFPPGRDGDYVMPDNVTSLTSYAFQGSQKLTSVNIPASVKTTGDCPFAACTSLTSINVSLDNTNFKSIDGVFLTHNGTNLIQYPCGKNDIYVVPDKVSTIAPFSFSGCTGVKSVLFSSSVSTIGSYAFSDCSGLTSITIPSTVTSFGSAVFYGCTNLVSILVDPDSTSFKDIDGVLFNYDKTTLLQYPCGHSDSYTIPDNVTTVGMLAFYKCSGLSSVTFPSSINDIGYGAFNSVDLAYVDYLGSNEPKCNKEVTFGSVDVVCVPLDYVSDSSTFCGRYRVKVSSCDEFVAQQNQCYEVLEWQAEEITVKKRANATLWEKKTNNCFEYQCVNTSGGIAWSKCNTTYDMRRMCIDNECFEEEAVEKDKYAVEMSVNISASDFDMEELTYVLKNMTGDVEMRIGTETTSTTGNVIRIVVFVGDQDNANMIVNMVENKEECTYGVLCEANDVQLVNMEDSEKDEKDSENGESRIEEFVVISGAHNISSVDLIVLVVSSLSLIIMMI